MYAKQEAETRVRNFKAQYEAKYRELNEQKERLANREKELKEEESKINESVSNKVGYIYDQLEKKIPIQTQLPVYILCWNNAL